MAKSTKSNKKEKPVKLNTSFEELVNMSVAGNPKPKKTTKKKIKYEEELDEREIGGEG